MKNNFIYLIIFTTFTIAQDFATLGAPLKTASLLERRGDIDGAIAIYKGILEKNSNHRSSLQKLKSIYMNYQRFEEGIEFLRGRLPNEPNNMKLFPELGEFFFSLPVIKSFPSPVNTSSIKTFSAIKNSLNPI